MLGSQVFDLASLLTDDMRGIRKLGVDQLLVLQVDQRAKEDDAGEEQRHAPEGEQLDEIVGEECGQKSLIMSVSSS